MSRIFFLILWICVYNCHCPSVKEHGYGYGCGYTAELGEGVCQCYFFDETMMADCTEYSQLTSFPEFTSNELRNMDTVDMTGTQACDYNDLDEVAPPTVKIVCDEENGAVTGTLGIVSETRGVKHGSYRGLIVGVSVACIAAVVATIIAGIVYKVRKFHIIESSNEVLFHMQHEVHTIRVCESHIYTHKRHGKIRDS